MKIRNKKTGQIVDVPSHMEGHIMKTLQEGGDPLPILKKGGAVDLNAFYNQPRFIQTNIMQEGGDPQSEETDEKLQQLIMSYAQASGTDPNELLQQLQQLGPEEQQGMIQQMYQALLQGGQEQQPQMGGGGPFDKTGQRPLDFNDYIYKKQYGDRPSPEEPGFPGELLGMGFIGALNFDAQHINNYRVNTEKMLRDVNRGNSDNKFQTINKDSANGNYTLNQGILRPNQGTAGFAEKGGEPTKVYNVGDEIDMTPSELAQFMRMGGQVDFV